MRNIKFLSAIALLALAACGGGGGPASSYATVPNSGGGSASVSAVQVTSDLATIPADGSVSANIAVLVKDANNNALSGVSVAIAANAGTLVVTQALTDATGLAKASLSALGVAVGTSITVTATAGNVSRTASVGVVNTQRTIAVVTSLPQIPSDSSQAATISALVRDANNNVVAGQTVLFQSTSGALAVTQAVTDATGVAKATLTAGTDPSNRTITVTATSGTATANVQVQVTGTTLTITGASSIILGQTGNYSVALKNSAGQGISGATVTLTSSKGNTLSIPAATNVSGQTSFNLTATIGGTDTITASSLGMQQQISVAVSTDTFVFTVPASGANVSLGVSQTVTVNWQSAGVPQVGKAVSLTTTRGTLTASNLLTDASGNATTTISSTSAGPAVISATGTGVSAQLNFSFVAVTPSQVAVQASPATVVVGGQSAISATVRDAANNLVQGAQVNFQIVTDPTNGGLQQSSVVSNAQGVAQTVYTAGNTGSGANGVSIKATVNGTAINSTVTLTVGGQAVFLSLGTGNTIDISVPSIYQIVYSVFAVDATGAALANVPITVSILPVAYGKGWFIGCNPGPGWTPGYSTATNDAFAYSAMKLCKNEDTDYTGNINSSVGKDYNNNNKLEPGNIAVVTPGSGTTDSSGRLAVTVSYPRDHAYWLRVKLVAKTIVNGTESSTSSEWTMQGVSNDYVCTVAPPGPLGQDPAGNSAITSPYGVQNTCANPN